MKISEYTLTQCLSKFGLKGLPPALTKGNDSLWINAIVCVRKFGGIEYCIANNDGYGKPIIVMDFGNAMAINEILSVHPIESVSGKFTPDLRSDKQIVQFLAKNGYDAKMIAGMLDKSAHEKPEDAKKDRDKVKQYINIVVLKIARKELSERERVAAIKKYAIERNGNKQRKKN